MLLHFFFNLLTYVVHCSHYSKCVYHNASSRQKDNHNHQIQKITKILCHPNSNVSKILSEAHIQSEKAYTTILSKLAKRKKKNVAISVWKWLKNAGLHRNVVHFNAMINGR